MALVRNMYQPSCGEHYIAEPPKLGYQGQCAAYCVWLITVPYFGQPLSSLYNNTCNLSRSETNMDVLTVSGKRRNGCVKVLRLKNGFCVIIAIRHIKS